MSCSLTNYGFLSNLHNFNARQLARATPFYFCLYVLHVILPLEFNDFLMREATVMYCGHGLWLVKINSVN